MNTKPLECRIGDRVFTLREVHGNDATSVESLFSRVFGYAPAPAWHGWKYGPNGLQGKASGLWDETGQLVAHYAGFPRTLHWQGKPVAALQIGDVMVAPELRGILTRRGPFFQVCSSFFGRWVGADKPYALAFGFPNERAIRLGEALGLYRNLGTIDRLVWPATRRPLPLGWCMEEITPANADFDHGLLQAWKAMRSDLAEFIVGTRDAACVRSRFVARPEGSYRFLRVRRRLLGPEAIAVLRTNAGHLTWLDFIGARPALPATIRALQTMAAEAAVAHVEAWASPAVCKVLAASNAAKMEAVAYFALARASACPDDTLSASGWWLGGDTDFL